MSIVPPIGDLIKIAAAVAESSAARPAGRCVACAAVGTVAAVLCVITASGCALTALWIYLLPEMGPVGAPLVVAGVLLVMCFIMLAVVRYGLTPRAPPPRAAAAPALLLADVTRLVKDNKAPVLLTALLAGLVAGRGEK